MIFLPGMVKMNVKQAAQCTLFSLFFASSSASADFQLNLSEGVTPVSHDIYQLHMTIFWITVVIGVVVFGVMLYSIIYHRKAPGKKPAKFHSHLWLEITWTVIPFIILIAMAIPAIKVLKRMHDVDQPDLSIKVTGYQWKWRYEYLNLGISFFSNISTPYDQIHGNAKKGPDYLREVDHPLVVPIHKKIRFLVTANDVIHGWWVLPLGVKQDAIPGYINENWARINRPGIYHGQCSKLCGMNHAYMPIVVIAMTEKDFNNWVLQQKNPGAKVAAPATPKNIANAPVATKTIPSAAKQTTLADSMKRGEQVYLSMCATCHKPDGTGSPPIFPALKDSAVAKGPVEKHIDIVMHGQPGTAMQAFQDQYSDEDLAAVITYERNAFGNNTGTVVQPQDIAAKR
jgi:cytochrome c oxidase subunit 2